MSAIINKPLTKNNTISEQERNTIIKTEENRNIKQSDIENDTNYITIEDLDIDNLTPDQVAKLRGPQGATGIYNPDDPETPAFELDTKLGLSDTNTITQKTATELLLKEKQPIDLYKYPLVKAYVASATGLWTNGDVETLNSDTGGVFLPVVPGGFYKIITPNYMTFYCLLKTTDYTIGEAPGDNYATGYTGRVDIAANSEEIIQIPSDANYMYIFVQNTGNYRPPYVYRLTVGADEDENVEEVDEVDLKSIDIMSVSSSDYWTTAHIINNNTGKWAAVGSATGTKERRTTIIPVEGGKTYYIIPKINMSYAFISKAPTHGSVSNSTVQYADGYNALRVLYAEKLMKIKAPINAKYFAYMSIGVSKEDRELILLGVEREANNLSSRTPTETIYHKDINLDGTLIEYQEGETYYDTFIIKKYSLLNYHNYYASARCTATTRLGVAYYKTVNDSPVFLGEDPAFKHEITGLRNKVKLTPPNDAEYVLVRGVQSLTSSGYFIPDVFVETTSIKADPIPLVVEYHEATIRNEVYISNADGEDPTDSSKIEVQYIKSPWAVMWPTTYMPYGKPTQVIAMLHGANGSVTRSQVFTTAAGNDGIGKFGSTNYVLGYPLSTHLPWGKWRERYLQEGFAVLDINGVGGDNTKTFPDNTHYGAPQAVETLNKAFEYLKEHYNVCDKLLVHGTSMGGALAQTYTRTYPNNVIAVAVFAPAPLVYCIRFNTNRDDIVSRYGYTDSEEAEADNFERMVGPVPLMRCLAWHDGEITEVNWSEIETASDAYNNYEMIETFPVPIRCWQGLSDSVVHPIFSKKLFEAYRRSNSQATLRLCDGVGHEACVGEVSYVVDEAIEYFKYFTK